MDGILFAAVQSPEDEIAIECVRDPNSKETCRKFLRLMRANPGNLVSNERRSYQTGNPPILVNTLIAEDKTVLLAACKEDFSRAAVFECLAEVKKAYAQNRQNRSGVERALKANVEKYSSGKDKIAEIKDKLVDVKAVMLENIDKVLERGNKIDSLVDSSTELLQQAEVFETQSRDLKYAMYKKRCIIIMVVLCVLVIVAFIIAILVCRKDGVNFDGCTGSSSSSSSSSEGTTTGAPAAPTEKPTTPKPFLIA
jgi:hypothetical protein